MAQSMTIASRHIEYSRKLTGPAVMPEPDLGDQIQRMTDPKQICLLLRDSIVAQHPIRAERLLVRKMNIE